MSIESFHRSLHCTSDSEPLLIRLRAITKIEDPAQMVAVGDESQAGGWPEWTSSGSAPGLS